MFCFDFRGLLLFFEYSGWRLSSFPSILCLDGDSSELLGLVRQFIKRRWRIAYSMFSNNLKELLRMIDLFVWNFTPNAMKDQTIKNSVPDTIKAITIFSDNEKEMLKNNYWYAFFYFRYSTTSRFILLLLILTAWRFRRYTRFLVRRTTTWESL